MAGRGSVQAECNKLNAVRAVQVRSKLGFADFWASARGSFVIEGGYEESRAMALVTKLSQEMTRQNGATIVLTASQVVEDALVSWVKQACSGYLQVCSPTYPNYDYFYGWDDAEIAGFLVSMAQERNLADPNLIQLIAAFVSVLRSCYRPSLNSMRALAEYDGPQIAGMGEARGVAAYQVSTLRTVPAATMNTFRFLLDWLIHALPSSTLGAETGENFSAVRLYPNETYLVNVGSPQPAAVNTYFAHELERALDQGMLERVVLADVPLATAGPLVTTLLGAQMRGKEVGISLVNASRMLQMAETEFGGLVFGSRVVLLEGDGLSAGDLAVALQPLGVYQYHYPVLSTPGFSGFDFLGSKDEWSIATEERLRVRPEDTTGFAGVFYGNQKRTVSLVRSCW